MNIGEKTKAESRCVDTWLILNPQSRLLAEAALASVTRMGHAKSSGQGVAGMGAPTLLKEQPSASHLLLLCRTQHKNNVASIWSSLGSLDSRPVRTA